MTNKQAQPSNVRVVLLLVLIILGAVATSLVFTLGLDYEFLAPFGLGLAASGAGAQAAISWAEARDKTPLPRADGVAVVATFAGALLTVGVTASDLAEDSNAVGAVLWAVFVGAFLAITTVALLRGFAKVAPAASNVAKDDERCLASLHARGRLTDDEFQAAKARMLNDSH